MKVLYCLLVIVSLISLIEAKKKKKSENEDRRPVSIEPLLYCNSCVAVVRESLKKLKDSRREMDVDDTLSTICNQRNFAVYEYPPPDMKKGCEAFIGGWSEEVQVALMKRTNNSQIEDHICNTVTKACVEVQKGARKANDDFITVNGKKIKTGDDGRVDINTQESTSNQDDDL